MPTGLNTARLYSQLQITGLAIKDQPLFQLIRSLIDDLVKVGNITGSGSGGGGGGGSNVTNNYIQQLVATLGSGDSSGDDSPIIPGPPGIQGIQGIPGISGVQTYAFLSLDGNDGEDSMVPGPAGLTGPAGSASGLLTASLTLTNAQILALNTTPIDIIAAQGTHAVVIPVFVSLHLDSFAGAFGGNSSFELRYSRNTTSIFSQGTFFRTQNEQRYCYGPAVNNFIISSAVATPWSAIVNNKVVITSVNAQSGGNAANVCEVQVIYVVYDPFDA